MKKLMEIIEMYFELFNDLVDEIKELKKRIVDLEDDVKELKFGE